MIFIVERVGKVEAQALGERILEGNGAKKRSPGRRHKTNVVRY